MSGKNSHPETEEEGGGVAVADAPVETEQTSATPEEPQQAAASPEESPVALSDVEKRYLARRPAIEGAIKNIEGAKSDLSEALEAHEESKRQVKGKEAALEAAWNALYRAEKEDPQQLDLFSQSKPFAPDDPEFDAAQKAWDAKWADFLAQDIEVLELSEGLVEKLEAHDPSIDTLKTLTEVHAASEGHGYTAIKGVGKGNADKIEAAYDALLAKFVAAHPQPKKAEPATGADAAPSADGGEWDFESTFPTLINGGGNETFSADDHRNVIDDALAELKEIAIFKDCLSREVDEAGKAMTAAATKKMQTKLGEAQEQFDGSIDTYTEKFGNRAGEALRRHVEGVAEKKAALKGGLD